MADLGRRIAGDLAERRSLAWMLLLGDAISRRGEPGALSRPWVAIERRPAQAASPPPGRRARSPGGG